MVYIDYDPNDDLEEISFCGDTTPHEPHDNEGTASGRYFITTCPGVETNEVLDELINEERKTDNSRTEQPS